MGKRSPEELVLFVEVPRTAHGRGERFKDGEFGAAARPRHSEFLGFESLFVRGGGVSGRSGGVVGLGGYCRLFCRRTIGCYVTPCGCVTTLRSDTGW